MTIEHVVELAELLNERIGLKSTADGYHSLRIALQARLANRGRAPDEYLKALRTKEGETELRQLLPLVTVGKTEFFRDARQFKALREKVLPDLIRSARREKRKLAVWSAGCATGEEPYSLAILASEIGILPAEMHLVATDVNPVAVATAQEGIFPPRRMKGLSPDQITRFFESRHGNFQVRASVREPLSFGVHNLASDEQPVPPGGRWDLILCRNVFIYFELTIMARTVGRMHASLRTGGYLFIGYSESLYRIFDGFELAEIEGAFVYRKPAEGAVLAPRRSARDMTESVDALHRSIEEMRRHRKLAAPSAPATAAPTSPLRAPPSPPPPPEAPPQLDRVAKLVGDGKFDQATAILETSLSQNPDDLAARLTLGNLLCVTGRFDEACKAYEAAIGLQPLSAEAHALLGVARAEAGQLAEARRELSRALFLEPALPLAYYYLGRVAEKGKDHDAARRAYRNVIEASRNPNARKRFLSYYPDLPEDPNVLSRAAEYALGLVE